MHLKKTITIGICLALWAVSVAQAQPADSLQYALAQWRQVLDLPALHRPGSKRVYHAANEAQLHAALQKAARRGGTVLLAAGTYRLDAPLHLPTGVVLRGAHRDSTRLLVYIKAPFAAHESGKRAGAVVMKKVQYSGLENLTVQYKAAAFAPNDKDSLTAAWDRTVFHVQESRDTLLFVDLVLIDSAQHCWVKNCRLLWAGNDPVHITASQYISCSGNYVDRAYNKSDRGQGYYNIIRSSHVLVQADTIRRLRHFSIHRGAQYVVVQGCYMEVDINFHSGDGGYNLVYGNTLRIPTWHSWNAIARGDPRQHLPPGPYNLLLSNSFTNKNGQRIASEAGVLYRMNEQWEGGNFYPWQQAAASQIEKMLSTPKR